MNILVCCKIVNDLDQVLPGGWPEGPEEKVDISYTGRIFNYFDESALELALRLKDEHPAAFLTALTLAEREESLLKNLLALPFDRVARIALKRESEFAPLPSAARMAAFSRAEPAYDLILMGRQAGPADSGQVPFLCAEMLGLPCLTQVTGLRGLEKGFFQVRRLSDQGSETLTIKGPALLVIGNAENTFLRIPTLKQKLAARQREAETIPPSDGGSLYPGPLVRELRPQQRGRKLSMLEEDSLPRQAEKLYTLIQKQLARIRI
jgi:electron transfer flavoprotein alpha/beta subunit